MLNNSKDYARILNKGKSFECSKWSSLMSYTNNSIKQDFVSYEGGLYACINSIDIGGVDPKTDTNDGQHKGKFWISILKEPVAIKGDTGVGTTIKGFYNTEDALITAHPIGNPQDAYLINGHIYIWNDQWVDAGNLRGQDGSVNFDSLTEAQKLMLKGERGDRGVKGETGQNLTFKDLTLEELNTLRGPAAEEAKKASKSAEESFLIAKDANSYSKAAKVAAEDAAADAEAAYQNLLELKSYLDEIKNKTGETVDNLIAASIISSKVSDNSQRITELSRLEPKVFYEEDWDQLSDAAQKILINTYPTLYILEGSDGSSENIQVYYWNGEALTLSGNCTYINGELTLENATFEDGILTLTI